MPQCADLDFDFDLSRCAARPDQPTIAGNIGRLGKLVTGGGVWVSARAPRERCYLGRRRWLPRLRVAARLATPASGGRAPGGECRASAGAARRVGRVGGLVLAERNARRFPGLLSPFRAGEIVRHRSRSFRPPGNAVLPCRLRLSGAILQPRLIAGCSRFPALAACPADWLNVPYVRAGRRFSFPFSGAVLPASLGCQHWFTGTVGRPPRAAVIGAYLVCPVGPRTASRVRSGRPGHRSPGLPQNRA
jgi:hypothetical protein